MTAEDQDARIRASLAANQPPVPPALMGAIFTRTAEIGPGRPLGLHRFVRFGLQVAAIVIVVGIAYAATQLLPFGPTPEGAGGTSPDGLTDTAVGDQFELTLQVPRLRYRAGETIEPVATLSYIGSDPGAEIRSSSGGPVGFGVEREGGPRIGPGYHLDCQPGVVRRDQPLLVPFQKSGGWTDDDPHADFLEEYFLGQRALTLPAGRWTIWAETEMTLGGSCGGHRVELVAAVTVVVEDG